MRFEYRGKVYYRWTRGGSPMWTETTCEVSRVSDELADELERAFMGDPERARIWGPREDDGKVESTTWDYMGYLDEMERIEGGRSIPAGNIEPADAEHEPWVAARMAARA